MNSFFPAFLDLVGSMFFLLLFFAGISIFFIWGSLLWDMRKEEQKRKKEDKDFCKSVNSSEEELNVDELSLIAKDTARAQGEIITDKEAQTRALDILLLIEYYLVQRSKGIQVKPGFDESLIVEISDYLNDNINE